MNSVIISGGFGFLGSSLARAFIVYSKYPVKIIEKLENSCYKTTVPNSRRLSIYYDNSKCNNIGNEPFEKGTNILFHCTGNSFDFGSNVTDRNRKNILSDNYISFSTKDIFNMAEKLHIKKLVIFQHEQSNIKKIDFANKINIQYSFDIDIIRIPYLFGIYQSPYSYIPSSIINKLNGSDIINRKKVDKTMQLIYAEDLSKRIVTLYKNFKYNLSYLELKAPYISTNYLDKLIFDGCKGYQTYDTLYSSVYQKRSNTNLINFDLHFRILQTIQFYQDNLNYYRERLILYENKETKINCLKRPVVYGIGSGMYIKLDILKRIKMFPEPQEDLAIGYRMCMLGEEIIPIPLLNCMQPYFSYKQMTNAFSMTFLSAIQVWKEKK